MQSLPYLHVRLTIILLLLAMVAACGEAESSTTEPESTSIPTIVSSATPAENTTPADPSPELATPAENTTPADPTSQQIAPEKAVTHTIHNGGNMRSSPQIVSHNVIGQVCPGDQLAMLEEQDSWMQVSLVYPSADCVDERVAQGTVGWVSSSLTTVYQQKSQASDYPMMPDGLTAAIVTNIVDGDTLDVTIQGVQKRIRMIGIDTPETKHPSKPVECFGYEASAKATELLQGQVVALEEDSTQGNTDRYDRLLRFVWLLDGTLVNYEMVDQGYAFEYTYNAPYTYQQQFQAAQHAAREQQRGLWAETACNGKRTPDKQQPPPTATPMRDTPQPLPPTPTSVPVKPTPRPRTGNCDPAYPTVCISPPPPDLDCRDIPYCRFKVLPPDPHNFDGNGDGVGCERCP
jgi:micrococcal nuclease